MPFVSGVRGMTGYALPKLKLGITSLLVAAGWIALAVPSCVGQAGAATTPATSPPVSAPYLPTMTFDVASVRENKTADSHGGVTMSGQFAPHTTNLRLINWRIELLVSIAFGIDEHQITGAPKWPWPTVFVIEAKGDSAVDAKMATLTNDQQRPEQKHMLQALLEERFKLKTHWETKQGDIYNLVVAKGGPKLGVEGSLPPSADELKIFGDRSIPVNPPEGLWAGGRICCKWVHDG
jgi:hypothetical protein